MVPKDYIIPASYSFTKALSAGRQWVYFDYSAPDGYELIAVYGYVDYPTNVEITGFYAPKYIAVNCIADGTYTFQVNIACIKKI